jgi:hypothetical protein
MPATVRRAAIAPRNRLSANAFVKRRQHLIHDGPDRAQRVRGRYPRLHVDIGEQCPDAASDPRIPISHFVRPDGALLLIAHDRMMSPDV